jgi:hypothetical protein
MRLDPAAFASAVGRSFYQQILPRWRDVGLELLGRQWLSCVPTTIPDQLQVACSSDGGSRRIARQADEDWRSFLAHRGREMRAGAARRADDGAR